MPDHFAIGPSIGVARLGNSAHAFHLGPDAIGALPIECRQRGPDKGEPIRVDGRFKRVAKFRDGGGALKRQAASFAVFRFDDRHPLGVEIHASEVFDIRWTVHLANKKSCWYEFDGLRGNRLYPDNDYGPQPPVGPPSRPAVSRRNHEIADADRQRLLITDPGPRTVSRASPSADLSLRSARHLGIAHASFPASRGAGRTLVPDTKETRGVTTLGKIWMTPAGRLIVLGGRGISCEVEYANGARVLYDDIADGSVTCELRVSKEDEPIILHAWCIVAPPRLAPEVPSIVSLDDVMHDVAVRCLEPESALYDQGTGLFRKDYIADFDTEIKPILTRPARYRWVVDSPVFSSVSPPPFDATDPGDAHKVLRRAYRDLYRDPGPAPGAEPDSAKLYRREGAVRRFPLMPLNPGNNPLSNASNLIDKFLALTPTQYFLLTQWAEGRFEFRAPALEPEPRRLTRANVGNCAGGPFHPGVEVCWNVCHPNIYERPFEIRHAPVTPGPIAGLDPSRDETEFAQGCEPGDLTKRMGVPWQDDLRPCSQQRINFTMPQRNNAPPEYPAYPAFIAHWWPTHVPVDVITGDLTRKGQLAGRTAGERKAFQRGIDDMRKRWSDLGIVANRVGGRHRAVFEFFTERERTHFDPPAAPDAAVPAPGDGNAEH
jgi:L-lysine 6-oxidase